MKVGLSTSVIQRGKSGVAQYVFGLVNALARHASHNEFTLFVLEEDLPLFEFARKTAKIIPVSESFRSPVRNILWHQTVLPRLARAHGLEVLHVPSYRRMIRTASCALVATIHDLAPFHLEGKYDWKRMFYGRVVARWLAQCQDKIIAVSRRTRRDILRFFELPAAKVTVIHNGLDHTRFFPDSNEAAKLFVAQRYGLRGPFFLYIARLEHPGKNHVRLIEAFNQFKAETKSHWRLVFGGADWHGAHAIHSAIKGSPFNRDIDSLGFVAAEALPALYRAADVFVYPSLFEGFGFPPLEAMACGCPVLCSTRGALGEVVGDAAATADPENVVALKRQLVALAGDRLSRERLRKAGLARSRNFDWEHTASQTLEVYATALESYRTRLLQPSGIKRVESFKDGRRATTASYASVWGNDPL